MYCIDEHYFEHANHARVASGALIPGPREKHTECNSSDTGQLSVDAPTRPRGGGHTAEVSSKCGWWECRMSGPALSCRTGTARLDLLGEPALHITPEGAKKKPKAKHRKVKETYLKITKPTNQKETRHSILFHRQKTEKPCSGRERESSASFC